MKKITRLPFHFRNTVLTRFLLYFLLVIIITLCTTSYFLYNYFLSLFKDEVLSLNDRILNQVSSLSDDFIMTNMNELAFSLSLSNPYETYLPAFFSNSDENYWEVILSIRHKLDDLIFGNRDIVDSIFLYSKDRNLAVSQKILKHITEKEAMQQDEFFWIYQASMSSDSILWLDTRITKSYSTPTTAEGNIITLVCTYPISSSPQEARGYIGVNIKEEALSSYLVKFNSTQLGQLMIINSKGAIISHNDKSKLYADISKEHFVKEILLSEKVKNFRTNFENTDYIVSFRPSKYNNWYYVSLVPSKLLYEKDYYLRRRVFIVSIIIFIIVLVLSNIFSYKIYLPLKNFSINMELLHLAIVQLKAARLTMSI